MQQQNKSSEPKVKFGQDNNHCERVPEAVKLAYSTKTKEPITSKKLCSQDFDESDICLFSTSTINLKEHSISVISQLVGKVITNLDMSKTHGPDCIPMVVLKGCEPEISRTLAKLFNMSLK